MPDMAGFLLVHLQPSSPKAATSPQDHIAKVSLTVGLPRIYVTTWSGDPLNILNHHFSHEGAGADSDTYHRAHPSMKKMMRKEGQHTPRDSPRHYLPWFMSPLS